MTTVTYDNDNVVTLPRWTTSTNLGTLTRVSFPPECLKDLARFNHPATALGPPHAYITQGCALNKCCPPGGAYTEDWAYVTSYHSPGVCPSEYKRCDFQGTHPAFKTATDEIVRFCCPSNYACPAVTGDLIKPCESIATTRQLVITVYDDVEAQKPIATTTIDGVGGGPRAAETTGVINVAYPIQVRFKQGEDAALVLGGRVLPTVGSATLLVASATPSPGGNGGGGASSTNQNPSTSAGGGGGGGGSGRGIPMGLVVGVILVAAVGVAVAAIVAAMRVVRKRRREQGLPASAQQAAAMRAADVERRSQRTAQQRMAQQQQQQQQTGVEMFPPHGIPPDHRQRKLSVQHHGTATSSRVELQGNII
ncbi:hypothetical protein MCOR27_004547 [Pyricularia oryzae]|uniref:Uncharacterized protein n=2 Tax=Pyricularia oryzae TaxID=318829 RepID=A0A4P7NPT4_PYROR|nr:hypothetical protein MCOR01_002847 [Pyricularia oryzae]KAH9432899.1 hypothetical protein MCOR02_007574 [Pyricularia oryzae]KAI6262692.1 hypothetical protein MCOR19_001035 [Pyricularia oryzae]KAI6280766.1 hypothetical protein MCOR27_004547 [Pyricularia oryzae]KAI6314878.1 hypothetical protein MCOR34_004823 [Pyricularia oryzae]